MYIKVIQNTKRHDVGYHVQHQQDPQLSTTFILQFKIIFNTGLYRTPIVQLNWSNFGRRLRLDKNKQLFLVRGHTCLQFRNINLVYTC